MATASDTTAYDAALAFLYGRINYERAAIPAYRVQNFKLERMRDLMSRLGHPERDLAIIHVAGTKGKGSTSSMLASVLTKAGYRTGLYTSPHLERTEERLVIDGQICSPEVFVELVQAIRPAVDSMDAEAALATGPGSPTYFEIMTAMALWYFARQQTTAVVLEVGLGGRLDSTNIVTPLVSVITSISFDHMKQLGNTLAAIATEKAGIIKPGVPVVTGVTESEPLESITNIARQQHAPLIRVGRDFNYHYVAAGFDSADKLPRGELHYSSEQGHAVTRYEHVRLGMLGAHQAANAAVALATLQQLQARGWHIPAEAIHAGFADVRCQARIEVLRTNPTVVIDTAHNAASIAALIEVLAAGSGFRQRHLVFACSRDKDPAGMLKQLWPHFDRVYLTRFLNNPRSMAPEELAALAPSAADGKICTLCDDPVSAWQSAQRSATAEDLVCITGSFFLAAELRSVVRQGN